MSNLTGLRRSFVIQNVMDRLRDEGTARINNPDERQLVTGLIGLGDTQFSNVTLSTNADGSITLSKQYGLYRNQVQRNQPVKPTQTNQGTRKVTRAVTEKGVTVPQELLASIGAKGVVYLRPINSNTFLVNRTRGTNENTVSQRSYNDGRVVVNRTTLADVLNRSPRVGASVVFSPNGDTGNSLLVEVR